MLKGSSAALAALTVLLAAPAAAQDEMPAVVGQWEMTFETRRGPITQTLTFELDDGALMGTVETQRGTAPLTDVTIEGNRVSFSITRGRGDRTFTMRFVGTVEGDELTGEMAGPRGGQVPFTAKRIST